MNIDDDAQIDDITKFIRETVDKFPTTIRNASDAYAMKHRRDMDIEFEGYVLGLKDFPSFIPSGMTPSDEMYLRQRVMVVFDIGHKTDSVPCLIHNVAIPNLSSIFLYGKDDDTFENNVKILQMGKEMGVKLRVTGQFLNIQTSKAKSSLKTLFFVDTLSLERDVVSSLMTETDFEIFMKLCRDIGKRPIDVMIDELFTIFSCEDWFKKATLLFALSPTARQEQMHVGVIAAQGEGKDYWADYVLAPLVRSGKVEGKHTTTIASLVGAMDSNDLSKIGIGTLQKYNGARMVVSEMQTWTGSMWGAILGVLANGEVVISKGQMQDIRRPACLNMWFMGNPPTGLMQGDENESLKMLEGFGKDEYRIQIVSRMTLIFAKWKLNQEDEEMIKKIYKNIESDSKSKGNQLFEMDEEIRAMMFDASMNNALRGRAIRDRKRTLAATQGFAVNDGEDYIKRLLYQSFFREYLKYVSQIQVKIYDSMSMIERTINAMCERDEYEGILVVKGHRDNRKRIQFINLVRSFSKLNGRSFITMDDLGEAEKIFNTSIQTLNKDLPMAVITSGLSSSELIAIKYIKKNPGCDDDALRHELGLGKKSYQFYDNLMSRLLKNEYIASLGNDGYRVRDDKVGKVILEWLGFDGADAVSVSIKDRLKATGVNVDKEKSVDVVGVDVVEDKIPDGVWD